MRARLVHVFLLVAACATADDRDVSAPSDGRHESAPVAAPDFVSPAALHSAAGTYLLELQPPLCAMTDNESLRFEVRVADARTRRSALDVMLAIDAAMPEHGHGMNRVPRITRLGEGHFLVEGMYFHMTGRWELYFDVTRGALTERTQCRVEFSDE
ncbi:MAG: hypothetical protein FJ298_04715 [Planctomycetes bacterium]|nr:hypothetical protein [Planctomycetota bacterium]